MQQDYTPESFKKGQQFEQFVEQNIFTEARYELITRTNSYEQNSVRYAEDTLKPDFKFRCKETGQEFWVEAKYRSELYHDQLEALSFTQRDRFYMLEKEEGLPVFVIIGYWGVAYKPNALSFIPLNDYEYIPIYRSFLRRFQIPIGPLSNKILKFKEKLESKEREDHSAEKAKDNQHEKSKSEIPEKRKLFNPKFAGIAAAGLLVLIMLIYGFGFSKEGPVKSPEENLKEIVENYYQTINSNQVDQLPEFLSPRVEQWYGSKNPTHQEILQIARDRHGKYPYSTSEIDWESFTVMPQISGDYLVTYIMTYGFKKKISDDYQIYRLKMYTDWDENFKLKSIREISL